MTIYKKHIRIHSRFLFSERMSLVTITSIKVEDDFWSIIKSPGYSKKEPDISSALPRKNLITKMCIIHLHRINYTDFKSTGRLTSVIVSENSQKKKLVED